MKTITSDKNYVATEHYVLEVTNEPTVIDFVQQIDDIMISSPDGDVLVSWDNNDFNENNCMLIKSFDNLKELGVTRCTHFYIMAKEQNVTLKVYITAQRN